MNVLVSGSLAFDFIMDFPGYFKDHIDPSKLHILNVSFLVESLKKLRGGTAGNIAYNLVLLKQPVSILAAAGKDFSEYEEFLKNAEVDTSGIKVFEDEFTARGNIITDKDDNQITAFYTGAMKHSSKLSTPDIDDTFVVIAPNDPEAMLKLVRECKDSKTPYMFDPGMQLPRLSDDQIKDGITGAEILIGNDYEMGIILKRLNLKEEDLLDYSKVIITTLGKEGALVLSKEGKVKVSPAKANEVLDPTGAGDSFRAGFLKGYLNKLGLRISAQMGSVAACFTIETYGTTTHRFSVEEFKNRYKENYGEELNLSQVF
jgi:adenosine kinase